jgi:hypothetical protein
MEIITIYLIGVLIFKNNSIEVISNCMSSLFPNEDIITKKEIES